MIRADHWRIGVWTLIAAVSFAGTAFGQSSNNNNTPSNQGQPVRSQAPGRMSGLGGVRSQPGVRSAAPRPIPMPTFGRPITNDQTVGPAITLPSTQPRIITSPGFDGRRDSRFFGEPRHVIVPVVGDGINISGSYKDGPFSLVFSTGGLGRVIVPRDGFITPIYFGGYSGLLPYGVGTYFGDGSYFSAGYCSSCQYSQVGPAPGGQESAVNPMQPQPSMSAPRTPLERASDMLSTGDAKGAVNAFQAYLKQNPNDADAMRLLGLSLLDAGRMVDGIAMFGMAYRSDSTLPTRPFSVDVFSGGAAKTRQYLNRVSAHANRDGSATSWLTLASFMQAEGRDKQARAMIERARKAGLEPQIVQEMTSALSGVDQTTR
jgi:hypothetical protein